MNTPRILLAGAIAMLTMVSISGCGSGSDAFTPVNDQFPTSLTITATSVVIGGPMKAGTVTADAVTVEPGGTDVFIPERATVSDATWSYTITNTPSSALTTKVVQVRWFKDGLQIAYRKVTVTAE